MISKEQDIRSQMLQQFFDRFGSIKTPNCLQCNQKVQAIGVDFHIEGDLYEIWVECHGERQSIYERSYNVLKEYEVMEIKHAFHPMDKHGMRQKAKIIKEVIEDVEKREKRLDEEAELEVRDWLGTPKAD